MGDDKTKKDGKKEAKDLEMNLDEFGTLRSNISIDKLNDYLDDHLDDKKLKDQKKKSED